MDKKLNLEYMLTLVDHTALKPFTTWEDIDKLCAQAIAYKTASVCIPPNYVKNVSEKYGKKLTICTVMGFPLGYAKTEVKLAEARLALDDGADELDMVINLCDVKNGNFEAVEKEIAALKQVCGEKILKVIVETCFLTDAEKIELCKIITKVGADYIKTSTGFGTDGARLEDIELFKKNIGKNVKIKASGGIRTVESMEKFIAHGCDRIGASSVVPK